MKSESQTVPFPLKRAAVALVAICVLSAGPLFGAAWACEIETTADITRDSVDKVCSRLCSPFGGWTDRPDRTLPPGPQFVRCECREPAGTEPCEDK